LPIIRVAFAFPDLIDICVLYSNVRQKTIPRIDEFCLWPGQLTTAMIWSSIIFLLYYNQARTKKTRDNLREGP
jgi:hypothetical protein